MRSLEVTMRMIAFALLLLGCSTGFGQALSGVCLLSSVHGVNQTAKAKLMLAQVDCDDGSDGCSDMNNSTMEWSRWTGVSTKMLQSEGSALTARMSGEAGELTCQGNV